MNIYRLINALNNMHLKGTGRVAELLRRYFLPPMRSDMIIRTPYGFSLRIDPVHDVGIERQLYYNGSYENGTLHVMKQVLQPGDVFVDIGGNIGLMSLYAAKLVGPSGRVFTFEPHPHTFSILQENVTLNQAHAIQLINQAVGAQAATVQLYDRPDIGRGAATLIPPVESTTSYPVVQTRLDDYFPDGSRIDLLKIDIEGRELEALQGAQRILSAAEPPALIVEYSVDNRSSDALYDFLREINDYRLFKFKIWKGKVCPLVEIQSKAELPRHDNVCCFTTGQLEGLAGRMFAGQ